MVTFDIEDVKGVSRHFYLDGTLYKNLARAKEDIVNDDRDYMFVVDGRERIGKSVFAMQMAFFLDNTLTLDRITFTAAEFKAAVLKAEAGQAVIYDEAMTGLSSKDTMSRVNKSLIEMMAEIGQKNLFIILVIPSFFELAKYAAIHRSDALIHIERGEEDGKRGYFKFYNHDTKIFLYQDGKKYYNYKGTKYNFHGRFTNAYVIDERAYRAKKAKSLSQKGADEIKELEDNRQEWLFNELLSIPHDELSINDRLKILKMPHSTYYYRLQQHKQALAEQEETNKFL